MSGKQYRCKTVWINILIGKVFQKYHAYKKYLFFNAATIAVLGYLINKQTKKTDALSFEGIMVKLEKKCFNVAIHFNDWCF